VANVVGGRCFGGGGCLAHVYDDFALRNGSERRRRWHGCASSTHKSSNSVGTASCGASGNQSSTRRNAKHNNRYTGFASGGRSSGATDNEPAEQCSGAGNAGFARRYAAGGSNHSGADETQGQADEASACAKEGAICATTGSSACGRQACCQGADTRSASCQAGCAGASESYGGGTSRSVGTSTVRN